MLKTRPKQLLGYLPLDITLPVLGLWQLPADKTALLTSRDPKS
jgi:hypothetical protein